MPKRILSVFRNLLRKRAVEQALDDELRSSVEVLTGERMKQGLSRSMARREALIELGGLEQVKEEIRAGRAGRILEDFTRDVRFGFRTLAKAPGFTIVAVLTLALGIGANTAIFSVVYGVLLSPLPYAHPTRLVLMLESASRSKAPLSLSYLDFRDWQHGTLSFDRMAAFSWHDFDLTAPGTPERVEGKEISAGFFATLGVKLALGHEFTPQEDQHGVAPVAIISDRLWRGRFAGSPEALGKVVALDGVERTIVGILPPRFQFEGEAEVYTPLGQGDPTILNNRTVHPGIVSIARLKRGVGIAQAQLEMNALQRHLDQLYPEADRGLGGDVKPLKQEIVGSVAGTLLVLLGAVGLVLLIACANFASLLLARSTVRRREFAIRMALGASPMRVVRQLLTESVILSLAGGGVGLMVAAWSMKPLLAAVPGNLPRSNDIHLNVPVLAFAFGIAVIVGVVFGFIPASKSSKANLREGLQEGGRTSPAGQYRAQSSLVICQMALTFVLLAGAGLLFRTILHLWEINPGFNMQGIVTFKVGVSISPANTATEIQIAYRQLLEQIRRLPGVQAADVSTAVPLGGGLTVPFWIGSQKPLATWGAPRAVLFETGPEYLRVMEIPLLRGRFFTPEDTSSSAPVAVIDTVLARTYFPGRNPVGQSITLAHLAHEGPLTIIGVVGHVRQWGLSRHTGFPQNQVYTPFEQMPARWATVLYRSTTMMLRTPLAPNAVVPMIRKAVRGAGKGEPVYDVATMRQIASRSMSSQRFPMILIGIFAALALVLATVGTYGVISYSVSHRVHEIGIRVALGAQRRDIFQMVIGQGFRLSAIGLAIGAVAALILARLIGSFSHLLYGVGGSDPVTFASVSTLLIAVSVVACYIPARRAAEVDPMVALRSE